MKWKLDGNKLVHHAKRIMPSLDEYDVHAILASLYHFFSLISSLLFVRIRYFASLINCEKNGIRWNGILSVGKINVKMRYKCFWKIMF